MEMNETEVVVNNMVGKTIISTETRRNYENGTSFVVIHFNDGTKVAITPSSYNYGPQNVIFEEYSS